jgi:uncharacterized protein YndB with AHSA1/START domain
LAAVTACHSLISTLRKATVNATYVELKPNQLIRYSNQFEDPNLPGEMQVRVELTTVLCGTELNIVQSGIPDVIRAEFCYLGWQESLTLLAQLVEPEIPDET